MEPAPLIEARGISVAVPVPHQAAPLVVVDRVTIDVWPGVSCAVVGRSGSGKTSLLSVLGLLNTDYTGTLLFDGADVASLSDRELARLRARHLGFVFQNYSLIPHLSALANVLVPCASAGLRRSVALTRARQALADVGLADRGGALPAHLSGGEQQRVAIARALVNRPEVVLADEPTGALDTDTGAAVMDTLVARTRQAGTALVVVTHDPEVARLCDRRYVMERGGLREDVPGAATGTLAPGVAGLTGPPPPGETPVTARARSASPPAGTVRPDPSARPGRARRAAPDDDGGPA